MSIMAKRMIARVHRLVLSALCVCSFIGADCLAQSTGQDYALEFDGVTDSVVLPATATMMGSGFTFKNPNASGGCGCGSSFTV